MLHCPLPLPLPLQRRLARHELLLPIAAASCCLCICLCCRISNAGLQAVQLRQRLGQSGGACIKVRTPTATRLNMAL